VWKVFSLSIALAACGFPRPADVNPDGGAPPVDGDSSGDAYNVAPSNDLGLALDQSAQEKAITLPAGAVVNTDTGAVTSALVLRSRSPA
jgi:hypothetical protein